MEKNKIFALLLLIIFAAAAGLLAQTINNNAANNAVPSNTIWMVDFSNDAPPPAGIYASTNFCWDIGNRLVFSSVDSFLKITFNLPAGDYSKCKLNIIDRASSLAIERSYISSVYPADLNINNAEVMISVDVNGRYAVDNTGIYWLDDRVHSYNGGRFLKEGLNAVTVTINPRSVVRYELKSIELTR